MESSFGKMSLQKKVMRLKYKKDISLKQAWDEVLGKKTKRTTKKKTTKSKLYKSKLNQLSLLKLRKLAKKYKISCCRKGSKVLVKKSTLINRMLKSKHSKKILKDAHKKSKKVNKHKFGQPVNPSLSLLPYNNAPEYIKAGVPPLQSWSDITSGNTQAARNAHYKKIPTSFLTFNKVGNQKYSIGGMRPSLAPYGHPVSNNFGQYFH